MADRVILTMGCSDCKSRNYYFQRGKKKDFKVELKKFCKPCGKMTLHKEMK